MNVEAAIFLLWNKLMLDTAPEIYSEHAWPPKDLEILCSRLWLQLPVQVSYFVM